MPLSFMKKLFSLLGFLCFALISKSQTTVALRGDTVKIYKQGGTAELVLQNKTKDTLGFLENMGNGRTEFHTVISGTTFVPTSSGGTLVITGSNFEVTHPILRPTVTSSSPTSFSFVAGDYIESIYVDPTTTTLNFQVGSTTGTGTGSDYDLIPPINLATGSLNNFTINKRLTGSVTYYFQNISSSTIVSVNYHK